MTSATHGGVTSDESALAERRVAAGRTLPLLDAARTLRGRFGVRPLFYGVVVGSLVFVGVTIGGTFLGQGLAVLSDGLQDEAGNLGLDVFGTLSVIVLLSSLGLWTRVGFGGPDSWTDLRLLLFPAGFTLLPLISGISNADLDGAGQIALTLPQPFLTGFWEEGLIRGFFLYAVLVAALRSGRSPLTAVLGSAAVFGALHAIALVGGQEPGPVLTQVVFAALLGVGFSALLLRTNALWLLVLIHAAFDLGPALSASEPSDGFSIGPILFALPIALYGMFLLRKRRHTT